MEDQPGRADPVPADGSDADQSEQARRRRERQAQREREVMERRVARRRGAEGGADEKTTPPAMDGAIAGADDGAAERTQPPGDRAASAVPALGPDRTLDPRAAKRGTGKVVPLRGDAAGIDQRAELRGAQPEPEMDAPAAPGAPASRTRRLSLRAVPEDKPDARPMPPLPSPKAAAPAIAAPAVKPVPATAPDAPAPRPRVPLAGPARMRQRHVVMMVSFVLAVILPSIVVAWYMWGVALDQYASRVGFSVQREEAGSAVELLGGVTALSGSSSTDTDILYKYIQSRELIETVNARLNLVNIYTRPEDPVYTMPPNPTIEDIEAYWRRVVDLFYDTASHLIEVRVVAFRPEDAKAITDIILSESTRTLNEISAAGRADALRYAREELDVSKARLRDARQALTAFRVRTQIVDPAADVQGRMGLLNSLLSQQATALIELDLVAATAGPNDPRYIQAQRRVDVIEARLREERARFGDQPAAEDERYADLVAEFEALSVDLEFAQQAYLTSLATYDAAIAEAQRKSRYLATYLPPTLAERAEFPTRILVFSLATAALFALWSIAVLVYYTLRDRI